MQRQKIQASANPFRSRRHFTLLLGKFFETFEKSEVFESKRKIFIFLQFISPEISDLPRNATLFSPTLEVWIFLLLEKIRSLFL